MPRWDSCARNLVGAALVWCVSSACATAFTGSGCGLDPGVRYASLDQAALAAAFEIRCRNGPARRTLRPVEWAFNLFRDEGGYYAGAFHTDHQDLWVTIRVRKDAVASGHSHVGHAQSEPVCSKASSGCGGGEGLSAWDRSEEGILAAQQRAGRRLPHYLVTPTGRVRVWEWSEQRWRSREVSNCLAHPPSLVSR